MLWSPYEYTIIDTITRFPDRNKVNKKYFMGSLKPKDSILDLAFLHLALYTNKCIYDNALLLTFS